MEIFLPGGLERQGDGWKLSVRIRLVHAQIRRLLNHSSEWDAEAWGVPLSAAHIALAVANFSAKLLKRASRFGLVLNNEERQSFMMIWRYTGYLLGVPETILFRDEEEAYNFYRIADLCEPPPNVESIVLANGLINSAPVVAGIADPTERRQVVNHIYAVSRALIGDRLADQLHFPQQRTRGLLASLYMKNRFWYAVGAVFPQLAQNRKKDNLPKTAKRTTCPKPQKGQLAQNRKKDKFLGVLNISVYDQEGIAYKMPDKVDAEKSSEW